MNIWEILHIEPTTDKKVIRRAYAARTKVIHPEEKPEEFRQLHEAYQTALKYAEFASKREQDFESIVKDEVREKGKNFPVAENTVQSELLSFFAENQEKQQQRIEAFIQHWKELKNISEDTKGYEWWQEYLSSDDFQNIRWNAQILHLLIEEIDDKFFYGTNEVKMLFWKAYGFKENDESRYQGEQQQLWQCLYPAYEYYEKLFWAKEYDRKSKRAFCIFMAGVLVCALVICRLAFVHKHNKTESERLLIEQYMAEQYPGIEFSVPERSKQQETYGVVYTFYSSAHPDLMITARIEYQYLDGEITGRVTEEDYGLRLLEHYADQYGLEYGQMEYVEDEYDSQEEGLYGVLYYPDIEQIDTFCETVAEMFAEQEELRMISSVGICAGDVLYPEVFLQGGVTDFHYDAPQIYNMRTTDEKELAARLKEVYIMYMFQYEPWNVSLQQCREWGPVYQELCWQWQNYRGIWYDMTDLHTGDVLCTIYVSTYMHIDRRYSMPLYEESVTVGNAYVLLLIQGVEVTVNEDGGRFIATINGQDVTFGSDPEVRIDKLGSLPIELQNKMQNNFFILE